MLMRAHFVTEICDFIYSYICLLIAPSKGVAPRSVKNEKNRLQVNTKLFRSLLDLPHKRGRQPGSTKRWKKHNVIVLLLSQLYCLKMGRGFRFL